jgi:hypothetical protein
MHSDRVAQTWRRHFVKKLQERYGLGEAEAHAKADLWLSWLGELPRRRVEPQSGLTSGINKRRRHCGPLTPVA